LLVALLPDGIYLSPDDLSSVDTMSSKKKNAPLPASSAGLLRFFEDETKGIKVKPELVMAITGAVIGASILIRIIFPIVAGK
jgi:preprotein translocase subunit Sec61beta